MVTMLSTGAPLGPQVEATLAEGGAGGEEEEQERATGGGGREREGREREGGRRSCNAEGEGERYPGSEGGKEGQEGERWGF